MPIVLVFADVAQLTFPHSTATAAKVVSTYGSTYAKDVVFNRSIMVTDKADGATGTGTCYSYMREASGAVSEVARNIYSVDSAMSKGTYSVGTLRTNGSEKTIDNAFEIDHEQLVVTSTSSTDSSQASTTAINYAGIQFSTDSASMYFGSEQQFRIRFGAGEAPNGGNTLSFDSKNGDGSYSARLSFTDEVA
ncbi:hypothetical protein JKP88DRAFT_241222 [Tribonema minus]|uniref:Uncharacterized protein n=1 Tax=Tribonema minus TaxID=303371 RepID=A0A836CEL6_9STRA|nr:hypothetical protein JKP88DRAFT_241222 [Tribonema minus]